MNPWFSGLIFEVRIEVFRVLVVYKVIHNVGCYIFKIKEERFQNAIESAAEPWFKELNSYLIGWTCFDQSRYGSISRRLYNMRTLFFVQVLAWWWRNTRLIIKTVFLQFSRWGFSGLYSQSKWLFLKGHNPSAINSDLYSFL